MKPNVSVTEMAISEAHKRRVGAYSSRLNNQFNMKKHCSTKQT